MKTLVRFFKDESGATMVEYAVLVALITVAVVAVVFLLGSQLQATFQDITECLKTPDSCPD